MTATFDAESSEPGGAGYQSAACLCEVVFNTRARALLKGRLPEE